MADIGKPIRQHTVISLRHPVTASKPPTRQPMPAAPVEPMRVPEKVDG